MLLLKHLLTTFILLAPSVYLTVIIVYFFPKLKESKYLLMAFVFLTIIFFNKLLFFDLTLAQKDFNDLQIPFFHFFQTSIKGSFLPPLWNNSFCGGFDNFAIPLAGYFSVYNWVFLLFENVYLAFNVYIALQVLTCLVFGYLMFLALNFKKHSAFFGAIVLTFNAFVTMRLSPGVGIEYLFSYKWLPLIFALFIEYKKQKSFKNILLLSIPFAFMLEGNPNVVISGVLLVFVFVLFFLKDLKPNILFLPISSFFIYAIKLIPAIPVLFSRSFSSIYQLGWRSSNYDFYMFPKIFLPMKVDFYNGYFTPGVVAILFFVIGLFCCLLGKDFTKKSVYIKAFFLTFVLAFLLTIEESPLFKLLYSFPLLNKVTIIPAFTIFFVFPIAFFSTLGVEMLLKKLPKLAYLISLLVFLEVLLGPSLFGPDSYSFNFAKMNYREEPYDFSYYRELSYLEDSYFYIQDRSDIFLYPYSVVSYDLKTVNTPAYFYGCRIQEDYSKEADYVLTMFPSEKSYYELVAKVNASNILDHKSHSVFEHKAEYLDLYNLGWRNDIYIYRNLAKEGSAPGEITNLNYISLPIVIGFLVSFCWFSFVVVYCAKILKQTRLR